MTAHRDSSTTRYCPKRKLTLGNHFLGTSQAATARSWSPAREPCLQRSWQRDSSEQHREQIGAL